MADEATLVAIIELILKTGIDSLPLIAIALLVMVLWFYRKDQHAWRESTRADLIASTQAIERNTAALNQQGDLMRLVLGAKNEK